MRATLHRSSLPWPFRLRRAGVCVCPASHLPASARHAECAERFGSSRVAGMPSRGNWPCRQAAAWVRLILPDHHVLAPGALTSSRRWPCTCRSRCPHQRREHKDLVLNVSACQCPAERARASTYRCKCVRLECAMRARVWWARNARQGCRTWPGRVEQY